MTTISNFSKPLALGLAVAVLAATYAPVVAGDATNAGIWRAQEGVPADIAAGPTSNDVRWIMATGEFRTSRPPDIASPNLPNLMGSLGSSHST
jgi:hypothetical protein